MVHSHLEKETTLALMQSKGNSVPILVTLAVLVDGNQTMQGLEALVFDVDGTLADTERDGHRLAFNRAFAEADLDWVWSVDLYGELLTVTGGKERIRYFIDNYDPPFPPPGDLADFIAGLHRSKTAHYERLMAEGAIPLRPGVRRLFDVARQAGLRLAIATTTTPANVTALIGSTLPPGAIDWFEVIGAGDIVPAKKPAPDIYQWVLREMGLAADRVIAFEDSAHGVTSAVDAGIGRVLVTVNGYTEGQDFGHASAVLDNLGEPGAPARTLAGPPPPEGVVDLGWLAALPASRP
jgi:beta-phosphoglucomutase-like phosphatase (HAD superfamily)